MEARVIELRIICCIDVEILKMRNGITRLAVGDFVKNADNEGDTTFC